MKYLKLFIVLAVGFGLGCGFHGAYFAKTYKARAQGYGAQLVIYWMALDDTCLENDGYEHRFYTCLYEKVPDNSDAWNYGAQLNVSPEDKAMAREMSKRWYKL